MRVFEITRSHDLHSDWRSTFAHDFNDWGARPKGKKQGIIQKYNTEFLFQEEEKSKYMTTEF